MSPATVLVFGATGKVGGPLVTQLVADHADGELRLIATARRPEAAAQLEQLGIDCRILDLDDAEQKGLAPVLTALDGVDRLFLLTSYDVKMPAQSKAVIDAAQQAGVSHILHLGAHASPATTIVHLGWHQLIDAYLAASGIGYTNLHPTSFMQNLFLLQAIGGAGPGVIPHYIGESATSSVDAEDVAAAPAVILRDPAPHAGRSYLLGAEKASMSEIVATLEEVTGEPWSEEQREPNAFFETVVRLGADPVYMACVRTIFERTARGELQDLAETSDAIERITGHPATTMRAFAEKHRCQLMRDATVPAAS